MQRAIVSFLSGENRRTKVSWMLINFKYARKKENAFHKQENIVGVEGLRVAVILLPK